HAGRSCLRKRSRERQGRWIKEELGSVFSSVPNSCFLLHPSRVSSFVLHVMKLPLVTFFFAVTFACATDVPITQDELVRRTQELYDAIVPGNQAPWKKYFAEDCIFA